MLQEGFPVQCLEIHEVSAALRVQDQSSARHWEPIDPLQAYLMRPKLLHTNMDTQRRTHREWEVGWGTACKQQSLKAKWTPLHFPCGTRGGYVQALALHQLPGSLERCEWAPEAVGWWGAAA